MVMLYVLKQGGLGSGGLNFDAKNRRESSDLEDFFIAHIGGMDAYARGLKAAAKIIEDGVLDGMVKERCGMAGCNMIFGLVLDLGTHLSSLHWVKSSGMAQPHWRSLRRRSKSTKLELRWILLESTST